LALDTVKEIEPRAPAGKEKNFSCPLFYWKKTIQNEKIYGET